MNLTDAAVLNNALWCAEVCAAHGIAGEWSAAAWTIPRRPPRFYPDAVTLTADATAADLSGRVDSGPGLSVKDSYGVLMYPGTHVLFEASWIAADPPTPGHTHLSWSPADDLDTWCAAWMADRGESTHPFASSLRDNPDMTFLSGTYDGRIVSGLIAFRAAGVASVSNVFGPPDGTWPDVRHAVSSAYPGLPIVGYESGEALAGVRAAGFHETGPLRVLYIPQRRT